MLFALLEADVFHPSTVGVFSGAVIVGAVTVQLVCVLYVLQLNAVVDDKVAPFAFHEAVKAVLFFVTAYHVPLAERVNLPVEAL